jgi:SAM-dependent methyltransferase
VPGYCFSCGAWLSLDPATAWCGHCTSRWQDRHRAALPVSLYLDGCCGIGGISAGLASAGHEVWGVDINPAVRDDYLRSGAAEFICADILEVLEDHSFMRQFDAATVSPECQGYSKMSHCRPGLAATYPRLIRPVRERLEALPFALPWVIENVSSSDARLEMQDPVTVLCMYGHFGRELYRHRLLRAGGGLVLSPPTPPAASVTASFRKPNPECGCTHPVATAKAGHWKPGMFVSVAGHERKEPVRRVMEIGWARKREDVAEAVPPYVGAWIAEQFEAHLGLAA